MTRLSKSQPTWKDVKDKLASFDRAGLLALVQDLYAAQKDNRMFLHSRLGLGEDILKPYKQTIERWLSPDVYRNQETSVAKAKQAISSYKKAVGDPGGLAELMVYYCELGAAFCYEFGNDDEGYLNALVHTFEQAFANVIKLPDDIRDALLDRLDGLRNICHNFGYGVADDMDEILGERPQQNKG